MIPGIPGSPGLLLRLVLEPNLAPGCFRARTVQLSAGMECKDVLVLVRDGE